MYQTVQELLAQGVPADRLWWMHLAHPMLMRMELGHLMDVAVRASGATTKNPAYLFLDEVTYARDWDTWLKTFFDERRPVRIIGTSSSTAALRQGRLESGVGRWEELYLTTCLFTEYLSLRGNAISMPVGATLADTIEQAIIARYATPALGAERLRYMFIGGFPELLMKNTPETEPQLFLFNGEADLASDLLRSQRVLRDDAVQKALYLDIPQVFGVSEPLNLERLLYTLAGQITGIMSFASLAADVGLTAPTLEKYVSYLERSFLIFLLPNYAPKEETVQRRGRKIYFVDGAVRNAALQRGIVPLRDPSETGVLIENMVASHLHALTQQTGSRLYHWRQGGHEVDLILDDPEKPLAFEIASSENHGTAGIRAFQERHQRFAGRCFLVYPDAPAILPESNAQGSMIGRLPLDLLLLSIGAQAEQAVRQRFSA